MYTKDAIIYFSTSPNDPRGAKKRITDALQLSSGYVSQWGATVPETQAARLHHVTGGKLKYDPGFYRETKTTTQISKS